MTRWVRLAPALRFGLACAVVAAGAGCARNVRPNLTPATPPKPAQFVAAEVIAEVKDFAVALGSHATDNFVRQSERQYYDKVSALYRDFQSGTLTPAQTLERKAELFAELQHACGAIMPEPVSFNRCPAAMNNAGLAFDRTYTRHYPMLHDLYTLLGGDTSMLVSTLKRLMANWPSSAANATDLINAH